MIQSKTVRQIHREYEEGNPLMWPQETPVVRLDDLKREIAHLFPFNPPHEGVNKILEDSLFGRVDPQDDPRFKTEGEERGQSYTKDCRALDSSGVSVESAPNTLRPIGRNYCVEPEKGSPVATEGDKSVVSSPSQDTEGGDYAGSDIPRTYSPSGKAVSPSVSSLDEPHDKRIYCRIGDCYTRVPVKGDLCRKHHKELMKKGRVPSVSSQVAVPLGEILGEMDGLQEMFGDEGDYQNMWEDWGDGWVAKQKKGGVSDD
jgi:hypothetical protein